MLDSQTFQTIVQSTPLVSIDFCLVCKGQILLGKRNKEPLRGQWFTPGGRIQKNESWQNALRRIALSELGMFVENLDVFELMGVWDHFYPNSMFDNKMSTHYINLPHFAKFESKPIINGDDQHDEFNWFDLGLVASDKEFHNYIKNYASYLINKEIKHVSN